MGSPPFWADSAFGIHSDFSGVRSALQPEIKSGMNAGRISLSIALNRQKVTLHATLEQFWLVLEKAGYSVLDYRTGALTVSYLEMPLSSSTARESYHTCRAVANVRL